MDALASKPLAFFAVPSHLHSQYRRAQEKLRFVEQGSLPMAKVEALRETCLAIVEEAAVLRAEADAAFQAHQHAASEAGGDSQGLPPDPAQVFDDELSAQHLLGILTFVVVQADLTQPLQMRTLVWAMADPQELKGERGFFVSLFELSLLFIAGRSLAVVDNEQLLLPRSFEPDDFEDETPDGDADEARESGLLTASAHGNAQPTLNTMSRLILAPKASALAGGRAPSMIGAGGARARLGSAIAADDTAAELSKALQLNVAVVVVKPHLLAAWGGEGAKANGAALAAVVPSQASKDAAQLVRSLLEAHEGVRVAREGQLPAREVAARAVALDQRGVAVGSGGVPYFVVEFSEDVLPWRAFLDTVGVCEHAQTSELACPSFSATSAIRGHLANPRAPCR